MPGSVPGMGRLQDLDIGLFERVATARLRGALPVLPPLGRAANHGVLWLTTAAVLGLSRNRAARRAAMRGVGSLALASATANVLAKQLTRRQRPVNDAVPLVRRLRRQPVTTSFPSGHSASAAAFATAVALESPWLGAAVAPLAAGVAASRVYTGVHYPGDVLAGIALGAGLAAATVRWWPLRDDAAADTARARVPVPALPGGEGLVVVVNSGSGSAASAESALRELLPSAELRIFHSDSDDLAELLAKAVQDASDLGGALGVVGGDGTVNAAAVAAAEHGLPLAVFPGGTLNHFAVDLGLTDPAVTAAAVEAGEGGSVDLGRVTSRDGGRGRGGAPEEVEHSYFLNTFSLGVYPELVRVRESLEKYLGKWPALGVALLRVLAGGRPSEVLVNGEPRLLWLLFAGNGRYDPPGFAPTFRGSLEDGLLDVRVVDGSHPFARSRLVAAFLTGTLARSRVYQAAAVPRLRVDGIGAPAHYARDGEVEPAAASLTLDKRTKSLTVYRPG